MAKKGNLRCEKLTLTVKIEKRTPIKKGANSIYMDMGTVEFEYGEFIGECHTAPAGGNGPVVTIRRKTEDEMAYRHYALRAKDFIESVIEHEQGGS